MGKETVTTKTEKDSIELNSKSFKERKIDTDIIALKQKMLQNRFSRTHIGERVIFALCDYLEAEYKNIDDEEIKKDRVNRLCTLYNLIIETKVVGEINPDALLIKKLDEYYNQYYTGKVFGTSLFSSLKRRLDAIYEEILNNNLMPNFIYSGTGEIVNLINENKELNKELISMSEDIKALTTTVENQENALHSLQEKNNNLTETLRQIEKNYEVELQKIDELNNEFSKNKESSEKEIEKLTTERGLLNTRIDKLEIVIKDSSKKNDTLIQECEMQRLRLEKKELENDVLTKKLEGLKVEISYVKENMGNFVKEEMQKFILLQMQQNQVNKSPDKTSGIPFFRNFGGFGK